MSPFPTDDGTYERRRRRRLRHCRQLRRRRRNRREMAREYVIVINAVAMITTIAIKGGLNRTGGFDVEFGSHEAGAEAGA